MSTMMERDRRWAVVGDESGYLSTGPSAPGGAGVLALLGLLCIAAVVWAVGAGSSAAVPDQQAPVSLASAALQSSTSSYTPGQSSGWHSHPGLHLVTVVSGTVTVYDRDCTAATYGPGQWYLGGDEPHLSRNDTEATLEMAVAYLPWPGHTLEGFRVDEPLPPTCAVA